MLVMVNQYKAADDVHDVWQQKLQQLTATAEGGGAAGVCVAGGGGGSY